MSMKKLFLFISIVLLFTSQLISAETYNPITPAEAIYGVMGFSAIAGINDLFIKCHIYTLAMLFAIGMSVKEGIIQGSIGPVIMKMLLVFFVAKVLIVPSENFDYTASVVSSDPEFDVQIESNKVSQILPGLDHKNMQANSIYPSSFFLRVNTALDALVYELIYVIDKSFTKSPAVAAQVKHDSSVMAMLPDPKMRSMLSGYNEVCYRKAISIMASKYQDASSYKKSSIVNTQVLKDFSILDLAKYYPSHKDIQKVYTSDYIKVLDTNVFRHEKCVQMTELLYEKMAIRHNELLQKDQELGVVMQNNFIAWQDAGGFLDWAGSYLGLTAGRKNASLEDYYEHLIKMHYQSYLGEQINVPKETAPESNIAKRTIAGIAAINNYYEYWNNWMFVKEAYQLRYFPHMMGLASMIMMIGFPFAVLAFLFEPNTLIDYFKYSFFLKSLMISLAILQKTEVMLSEYFGLFSVDRAQMTILLEQCIVLAFVISYVFISASLFAKSAASQFSMGLKSSSAGLNRNNMTNNFNKAKGQVVGAMNFVSNVATGGVGGLAKDVALGGAKGLAGSSSSPGSRTLGGMQNGPPKMLG